MVVVVVVVCVLFVMGGRECVVDHGDEYVEFLEIARFVGHFFDVFFAEFVAPYVLVVVIHDAA